jgi:hypothetical protein
MRVVMRVLMVVVVSAREWGSLRGGSVCAGVCGCDITGVGEGLPPRIQVAGASEVREGKGPGLAQRGRNIRTVRGEAPRHRAHTQLAPCLGVSLTGSIFARTSRTARRRRCSATATARAAARISSICCLESFLGFFGPSDSPAPPAPMEAQGVQGSTCGSRRE